MVHTGTKSMRPNLETEWSASDTSYHMEVTKSIRWPVCPKATEILSSGDDLMKPKSSCKEEVEKDSNSTFLAATMVL